MKKFATCSALCMALSALTSCAIDEDATTEAVEESTTDSAEQIVSAVETSEASPRQGLITFATTGSYPYSASNTNSAQQNTISRTISLTVGQSITLGTCGVAGASYTGDTYVRFFGPSGTEVAASDDACGGTGSSLTYIATSSGTYTIRAGCYGTTTCNGTVAWSITGNGNGQPSNGTYSYGTTNTNSAQQNTVDRQFHANAGQSVSVKICTTYSGDPYLRINGPDGAQVGYNDDGCNVQGATYSWTAATSGTYTIRAGCFSDTPCTGTVVWTVQ